MCSRSGRTSPSASVLLAHGTCGWSEVATHKLHRKFNFNSSIQIESARIPHRAIVIFQVHGINKLRPIVGSCDLKLEFIWRLATGAFTRLLFAQ